MILPVGKVAWDFNVYICILMETRNLGNQSNCAKSKVPLLSKHWIVRLNIFLRDPSYYSIWIVSLGLGYRRFIVKNILYDNISVHIGGIWVKSCHTGDFLFVNNLTRHTGYFYHEWSPKWQTYRQTCPKLHDYSYIGYFTTSCRRFLTKIPPIYS